jgi:hypothetical protein
VLRVALDEPDQLGDGHEAVRVVTLVGQPRQARLPVRGEQAQRVPALGLPGVGDLAALEHDVVQAMARERMTDREAGVPGPDHHHRNVRHVRVS